MFTHDSALDALMAVGVGLSLLSQVWLVIVIARHRAWDVLLYFLLFPWYAVYYVSRHQQRCRLPFGCMMFAAALELVALVLAGGLTTD